MPKEINILSITFSIKTVVSIVIVTALFVGQVLYVKGRLDKTDDNYLILKEGINNGTGLTFMLFKQLIDAGIVKGPDKQVMEEFEERYKLK